MMLFGIGIGVLVGGGLLTLVLKKSAGINKLGMASVVAGDAFVLAAAVEGIAGRYAGEVYQFFLPLPVGAVLFSLSPLSSFFLLIIAVVTGLAAVYAPKYLAHYGEMPWRFKAHWLLYNLLAASMMLVVTAQNAVFFMLAWEGMSLSSFFLVLFQNERTKVRRAGWIYLVFTHVGAACLLVMFALLAQVSGSFDFDAMRAAAAGFSPGLKAAIFVLALVGFGMKAGFFPMYVWLPEAHPAAPSHVSAVMSGVMIKTAIYGIVLTLGLLGGGQGTELWMGWTLVVLGLVSGIFGIAFAAVQQNAKRLLAYSSVENIGIIATGLGVWFIGMASSNEVLARLGLMAALLHTVNHALFKSLLFMGAGALQLATETLDLDRMGGLLKKMPRSGLAIIAGAVAISGLPPFNGFVGEFLLYSSVFAQGFGSSLVRAVYVIAILGGLSIIGALAVFTFTKLVGTSLLGEPRTDHAAHAHEVPASMYVPMLVLAGLCLFIGLFPLPVMSALKLVLADSGLADVGEFAAAVVPSPAAMQWIAFALIGLIGVLALVRSRVLSLHKVENTSRHKVGSTTWDCGYHNPTPRMQYTASSFAQPLASFAQPLYSPHSDGSIGPDLFPAPVTRKISFPDLILDRAIKPMYSWISRAFETFSIIQHGNTHWYVLYIVIALLAVLFWSFVI